MSRKRKREPSPYEVLESIQLRPQPGRNTPKDFVARVLASPSDYEVILAQSYEIADLRRRLSESADSDNSVKLDQDSE